VTFCHLTISTVSVPTKIKTTTFRRLLLVIKLYSCVPPSPGPPSETAGPLRSDTCSQGLGGWHMASPAPQPSTGSFTWDRKWRKFLHMKVSRKPFPEHFFPPLPLSSLPPSAPVGVQCRAQDSSGSHSPVDQESRATVVLSFKDCEK
jgi:hypothetical protein